MKKKMTPILAILLVILSLIFAVPSEKAPEADIPGESISGSGETTENTAGEPDQSASLPVQDVTDSENTVQEPDCGEEPALDPDGSYTTKEDVALYIHLYGCLPQNFMTKNEARELGWEGGGLEDFAPGMCIGGDRFGNYEGLLPDAPGRTWTECDIDTLGRDSRGAKRIVFSNDGLIYYTDDHYESFELLYGEE